jgi:hypothetical protein
MSSAAHSNNFFIVVALFQKAEVLTHTAIIMRRFAPHDNLFPQ